MINWNSAHWKIEQQANEFAWREIDALFALRPRLLCQIGFAGVAALKNVLMATWLSRQVAG